MQMVEEKTYYGPNNTNRHLGHVVCKLACLWKWAVFLGFVCIVVIMGVSLCSWGQKEEVVGSVDGCVQI